MRRLRRGEPVSRQRSPAQWRRVVQPWSPVQQRATVRSAGLQPRRGGSNTTAPPPRRQWRTRLSTGLGRHHSRNRFGQTRVTVVAWGPIFRPSYASRSFTSHSNPGTGDSHDRDSVGRDWLAATRLMAATSVRQQTTRKVDAVPMLCFRHRLEADGCAGVNRALTLVPLAC